MAEQLYKRPYWFGGGKFGGHNDQWKGSFKKDGIWVNGYSQKDNPSLARMVHQIQPFDLIALKKGGDPDKPLFIKALGVVKRNHGDGHTLDVQWYKEFGDEEREWHLDRKHLSATTGTLFSLSLNDDDSAEVRAKRKAFIDFAFWGVGADKGGLSYGRD